MSRFSPLIFACTSLVFWGCNVEVHYPGAGVQRAPIPELGLLADAGGVPDGETELVAPELQENVIAPFALVSAEPNSGPREGGTRVTLRGGQLDEVTAVYFGEREASEFTGKGPEELSADTPASEAGTVAITVLKADGTQAVLNDAFTFVADLSVTKVVPERGAALGGEPVEIVGTGFTESTRVLMDGREALAIHWMDETRLTLLTPGGGEGPVDVIAYDSTRFARLRDGFVYEKKGFLSHVQPSSGGLEGGDWVTLVGQHLDEVTEVFFGDEPSPVLDSWSGEAVAVFTPPGVAGPVDLRAVGPHGAFELMGGFVYLDGSETPGSLLSASPNQGPTSGGTDVFLTVVQPDTVEGVRFGEFEASSFQVVAENTIRARSPQGAEGPVAITLMGGVGEQTFLYQQEVALLSVDPSVGPREGGTSVEIQGGPFSPEAMVFFGPVPAPDVEWVDSSTLVVMTPPAPPGFSDVRVVDDGGQGTLADGFEFQSDELGIAAFKPTEGALSGGTFFRVYGYGFSGNATVFFGDEEATDVEVVSSTLLTGRTPAGEQGVVDVRVQFSEGEHLFSEAFTYFNPVSSYGGTWGGSADETVNITVLNLGSGEPVVDAFVYLDTEFAGGFQGMTDASGQLSFGAPNIMGEQIVSATKPGFTSNSVVAFDATNVILFLYDLTPSSSDPADPLPPSFVSGRVVGVDKYVPNPSSDCSDVQTPGAYFCAPCGEDSDCGEGVCASIDQGKDACTFGCEEDADCPPLSRCGAAPDLDGLVCVPSPLERAVRCSISDEYLSMATSGFSTWTWATFNSEYNTFEYEIESRYGDVAIFCEGGWLEVGTNGFLPMILGVLRHVSIVPGAVSEDRDVELTLPLTRAQDVRFDIVGGQGGLFAVDFVVELGSDGWKRMGTAASFDAGALLTIEGLPQSFSGPLYDASGVLFGGAYEGVDRGIPYSIAQEFGVAFEGAEPILLRENGQWVPKALGLESDLFAVHGVQGLDTWAVGRGGVIVRQEAGAENWGQTPSPSDANLRGVWASSDGDVVAVGDQGTLLGFDGVSWTVSTSPTVKDLRGVWLGEDGTGIAVGWHTVLRRDGSDWAMDETAPSLSFNGVWGANGESVWAVADFGRVAFYDGQSWTVTQTETQENLRAVWGMSPSLVFAVGDSGTVLFFDGNSWSLLPGVPTQQALQGVFGTLSSDGLDVYAVGSNGTLLHFDGALWSQEETTAVSDLHGVWEGADGVFAVGTTAALLGPFVAIPSIQVLDPSPGQGEPLEVTLDGLMGPVPDFRYAQVVTAGGFPIWTWTMAGDIQTFELPDLSALAGWSLLIENLPVSIRLYSVLMPGFDIDSYTNFDLNLMEWDSWSLMQTTLELGL